MRELKGQWIMKRAFDLLLASVVAIILLLPFLLICLLVKLTSVGPVFYWSKRVGKDNKLFLMPKFRSMRIDTPEVATHLLQDSKNYLTSIGPLLRKSSLDEIPQLYNILKGDMSFVGPRPALHNQEDLIALRTQNGIHQLVPGLTGFAQINGRDEISIPEKVKLDKIYMDQQCFFFDLKIIALTFFNVLARKNISH